LADPSNVKTAGLGVLFGKLQQGVTENEQVLTIARMRAEAEDVYGMRLGEIASATDKMQGGFSRDDGASVRKVRESTHLIEAVANEYHRHTMGCEQRWKKPRKTIEKLPKASGISLWHRSQDGVTRMQCEFRTHKMTSNPE
jgi:hypothetical protein